MEETTTQPTQTDIPQEITENQEPPSRKPWLIIGTGLLIVILLGTTGFFAYQNQQLKKQSDIPKITHTPVITKTPPQTTLATKESIVSPTQTVLNPTVIPTIDSSRNLTSDWQTYSNQTLGITVKYPSNLYFKEIDPSYGIALTFEPYPNPLTQGSYFDSIRIISDPYAGFVFDTLQKTADGTHLTGYDLHTACGIAVTKLRNKKIGTFDGVEYIYNGSNPPSDCGRDLIGYEHTILIRKSDNEFIKIINGSMIEDNTAQHDQVFDQILTTLKITN